MNIQTTQLCFSYPIANNPVLGLHICGRARLVLLWEFVPIRRKTTILGSTQRSIPQRFPFWCASSLFVNGFFGAKQPTQVTFSVRPRPCVLPSVHSVKHLVCLASIAPLSTCFTFTCQPRQWQTLISHGLPLESLIYKLFLKMINVVVIILNRNPPIPLNQRSAMVVIFLPSFIIDRLLEKISQNHSQYWRLYSFEECCFLITNKSNKQDV